MMEYEQLMLFMKLFTYWCLFSSIIMYFAMVEAKGLTHPTKVVIVHDAQIIYFEMLLILMTEIILIYFLGSRLSEMQGFGAVSANLILISFIELKHGSYSVLRFFYEHFANLLYNLSIQR